MHQYTLLLVGFIQVLALDFFATFLTHFYLHTYSILITDILKQTSLIFIFIYNINVVLAFCKTFRPNKKYQPLESKQFLKEQVYLKTKLLEEVHTNRLNHFILFTRI